MKKKLSKLLIIIPVIYISVIVALLYLHFTDNETFKEPSVNGLILSGTRTRGKEPHLISLDISYDQLRVHFSPQNALFLGDHKDNRTNFKVDSFRKTDNGYRIQFSGDVSLDFQSPGGELTFSLNLPAHLKAYKTIGFALGSNLSRGETARMPLVELINKEDNKRYYLWSRGQTISLEEDNTLVLTLDQENKIEGAFSRIYEKENPNIFWFRKNGLLAEKENFDQGFKDWLDKAYYGWSIGRRMSNNWLWKEKNGSPGLNPGMGKAYFPEALIRGEISQARTLYREAMKYQSDENFLNYASAFVGGLKEFATAISAKDNQRLEEVKSLITAGDPGVFNYSHIIPLILNKGNYGEISKLLEGVVIPLDPGKVDPSIALGIMETYFDALVWVKEDSSQFTKFDSLPWTKIVPNIIKRNDNIYFSTGDRISLRETIRAGMILVKWGEVKKDNALGPLGQKMILSVLALSDENGFLPSFMNLQGDTSGAIPPEEVYQYFPQTSNVPKEYPLYRILEQPGIWLYTAGELVDALKTEGGMEITVRFPRNETEYFFIRGLENVSGIKLYNYPFLSNIFYESGSDGVYFDAGEKTLFIKTKHYTENAKLEITF